MNARPLTAMQRAVLDAMPAPGPCASTWCSVAAIALRLNVPADRIRRTLCILHARGRVTKHGEGWWSKHATDVTAEECEEHDPLLGRLGG